MKPLRGVVVGIDAGIIGGEMFHLVEAMLGRIGVGLVAQMPLAGEIRRVTILPEEFGDRRRLLSEPVLIARGNHDRERRADRNTPRYERGASGRAARLAVPVREDGALLGYPIDVGRRMAETRAASRIGAEIIPAGIV